MSADLIGPDGEVISADSIRARMSEQSQRDIDEKMAQWFGRESEHSAYALEDVRQLFKYSR